jgi:hypothetical protein
MSITAAGRTMTAGMVAEVTTAQLSPILMVDMEFSTPVYLWTGYGTLTYGGKGYLGMGDLGNVAPIEETTDLSARGVTFQLSGVPTAFISLALDENYQGRNCSIMLGALSTTASLIASPVTVFVGKMDVMAISDDGEQAQITMSAESRLIDFRRVRESRYTDEEQTAIDPTDKGLEFVTAIQEKTIYWGNPNPTNPGLWNGGNDAPETDRNPDRII